MINSKQRKVIRQWGRMVLALFGAMQIVSVIADGFREPFGLLMGGLCLMGAATNFCTQCPLFSTFWKLVSRSNRRSIQTEKI